MSSSMFLLGLLGLGFSFSITVVFVLFSDESLILDHDGWGDVVSRE